MNMANQGKKINPPRLADLTPDPVLKRFFRRGDESGPMAAILPAPKPVAPAAREKELV